MANPEEIDDIDISTDDHDTDIDEDTEEGEETVESIKTKLEDERKARLKAEELRDNYKTRAEKAEGKNKTTKDTPKPAKEEVGLSTKDSYALMEAKVPLDDIDEVVEYARFAKIPVAEALKTNVVKTILADKAEARKVADATHTGSGRRTTGKVTDDALLDKASSGELPESDADLTRLVQARRNKLKG